MRRKTSIPVPTPAPRPELRKKVREALALLPVGRQVPISMLVGLVNELVPVAASQTQVAEAVDWNHDRGFVGSNHNEELERHEWFITKKGRELEQAS